MNAAVVVMRAVFAAGVIAGAGMWMDETRAISARSLPIAETRTISGDSGGRLSTVRGGGIIVDRYGNPIEEAVGDYRVDPRGDIFERHSPATEIQRLPEPSA